MVPSSPGYGTPPNDSSGYGKPTTAYHHGRLAEAAVAAGFEALAEAGPHGFTLAEVGKRVGVSAAALYRHFADKDALLAVLATESFGDFADTLRDASTASGPDRLQAMTRSYLAYANEYPARYALMFGMHRDQGKYPHLQRAADRAFHVLVDALGTPAPSLPPEALEATAVQVWAQCHGMASLRTALALVVEPDRLAALAVAAVTAIVERPQQAQAERPLP